MDKSILTTIKELLGIEADYTHFDPVITTHINSIFSVLTQLGVGGGKSFSIDGDTQTWGDYLGDETRLEDIKSYIYLRVRILFDPPQTGIVMDATERQIKELEWRINVTVDPDYKKEEA